MPRLQHEWTQTDKDVLVSLFVDHKQATDLVVDFQERECSVSMTWPTGVDVVFVLDPLSHAIDPVHSSYELAASQINLLLAKADIGRHWLDLEDTGNQSGLFENDSEASTSQPPATSSSSSVLDPEHSCPIQIMSDLHLEFYFRQPGGGAGPGYSVFDCTPAAPVLALIGDIGLANHDGLFTFLERQLYMYEKILYVMGNHEGYQTTYDAARARFHSFADQMRTRQVSNPSLGSFIFLDRTRHDLSEFVTVLGCTLWTSVPPAAMDVVRRAMNDFKLVQNWTVEDYNAAHSQDVQWLTRECAKIREQEPGRRVVVLTHHAPTVRGTSELKYQVSSASTAFATELTGHAVWGPPVSLWAFGHTHFNCNFVRSGVHVVSNPRGYEGTEASRIGFLSDFVVHA